MRARRLLVLGVAAAACALTLLALAAALALAVSRGWQRDRVRDAVASLLSRSLGAPVAITALEGPLYPTLELRGAVVGDPQSPLLAVSRAAARIDAAAWLHGGALRVASLELEGVHYALTRAEDGSLSGLGWSTAPLGDAEPAGGSPPWLTPLRVERLTLRDGRVTLRQAGESQARLDASVELDARDLALPWTPEASARAAAQLRVALGAPLPGAAGAVETARLEAEIREGRASIVGGMADGAFGRVQLEGGAGLAEWSAPDRPARAILTLALAGFDLEPLTGRPELATQLDGRGELEILLPALADWTGVELRGTASLRGSARATGAPSRAELRGSWRAGAWELAECALDGEGIALRASGRGAAESIELLALDARLDDLSRLAPWVGAAEPLAGSAQVRARLEGPLAWPRGTATLAADGLAHRGVALGDLRAELSSDAPRRLRVESLSLRGGPVDLETAGPARLAFPADGVRFEALRLANAGQSLEVEGELGAEAFRNLRVGARGLDVAFLAGLLGAPLALAGRASADLALDGPLRAPRVEGEAAWDRPRIGEVDLERVDATFRTEGAALRAELRARAEGREVLVARAELPAGAELAALLESPATRVELRAVDLDVAYLARLAGAPLALAGRASAELALDGPLRAPRVEGEAAWDRPRIGEVDLERVDATFRTEGAVLRAELRARAEGREVLVARAELPAGAELAALLESPATRVELRADGVELAALPLPLPRQLRDLRGRATAVATLRGGRPEPRVEGAIDLDGGSVTVPLLRQTFAPIVGRIDLSPQAVSFHALRIGSADAGAELGGRIALAQLRPTSADLRLALNDFPLSRSPLLRADASGELELEGSLEAPTLRGELELRDARVSLREAAEPALKEIQVLAAPGAGSGDLVEQPREPGLWDRAAADLRLRIPRGTWVRGRGAELEFEGALALRKESLEAPRVTGSAGVVRGTYVFMRKRFEVERGTATFDGGEEIDPLLDIEGVYRVRDVRVIVFVSGRASDHQVRIGSDPPMPESDALAYLLTGRPSAELTNSQSQGLESTAAGLAAGVAASELGTLLVDGLPVDTVDIRMDESGKPGEIGVGKNVSDRVFVRYGRQLGPEPVDEVRVEMRLNDNWSIETDVSSNESAGADLIWSLDY